MFRLLNKIKMKTKQTAQAKCVTKICWMNHCSNIGWWCFWGERGISYFRPWFSWAIPKVMLSINNPIIKARKRLYHYIVLQPTLPANRSGLYLRLGVAYCIFLSPSDWCWQYNRFKLSTGRGKYEICMIDCQTIYIV